MSGAAMIDKQGYFREPRSLEASLLWGMPMLYHRVFTWLRWNAQHTTHLFPVRGAYGVWVLPGQRLTSYRQIAEGVQWSEWGRPVMPNVKTVTAVLCWLESNGYITAVSNSKGTLVSIVNWSSYNGRLDEKITGKVTHKVTRSGLPEEHGPDTNKNIENVDKVEKTQKQTISPEAFRLAEMLADYISKNTHKHSQLRPGKRTSTVQRWAADIDKIIRIDMQEATDIESVIKWAHSDPFWSAQILSGENLRRKFDQLFIKMDQPNIQTRQWGAELDALFPTTAKKQRSEAP